MMRSLCLPIVFLLATFGSARASDLISQPEPAMLITPQTYNGSISIFAGDTSVANPSWFVQQTGAGSGAFTSGVNYNSAPGVSWQIANGTGRVQFYAAAQTNGPIENTYELAQAGGSSSIPCSTEEDLFASPIGAGAFKDANGNNVPSRASLSATLSNLSVISLQVGLTIPYEVISAKCPDINAAGYMAEVSLRSSTGYFIFFQVGFRSSAGLSGNLAPCGGYPSGNSYCFTTDAQFLGGPAGQQGVSGTRQFYNLNLYNYAMRAIQQTPDSNPADWRVEPGFFGSSYTGGVTIVSQWDSLKLSAY